jgi:hypothetical protein
VPNVQGLIGESLQSVVVLISRVCNHGPLSSDVEFETRLQRSSSAKPCSVSRMQASWLRWCTSSRLVFDSYKGDVVKFVWKTKHSRFNKSYLEGIQSRHRP